MIAGLCDLERATIRTALKAWQVQVEADAYDVELINPSLGVLTNEEIDALMADKIGGDEL